MRTFVSLLAIALATMLPACGDKSKTNPPPPKDAAQKDAAPAKDAATKDGAPVKDAAPTPPPVTPTKDAGSAKDGIAKDSASKDGAKKEEAVSLFDGKTVGKWKTTNFGGEGEVEVKDGQLVINTGAPLSGVTWQGDPPMKMNYEISLEAQRVEGSDFFLGLTVPVKDDSISLILGGWGGTLCGLSSLDGMDASENETQAFQNFKQGQWYKVRMQVREKTILVFLDDVKLIEANIDGRRIHTRIEVDLSKPLGIATYATTGAFRNIQMKKL